MQPEKRISGGNEKVWMERCQEKVNVIPYSKVTIHSRFDDTINRAEL